MILLALAVILQSWPIEYIEIRNNDKEKIRILINKYYPVIIANTVFYNGKILLKLRDGVILETGVRHFRDFFVFSVTQGITISFLPRCALGLIFFYGEKGTLFAEDSKVVIFTTGKDGKREDLSLPAPLMQDNHVKNFLDAVKLKDRNLISCTPEEAFLSTASVQLAMISYYTGSTVKWDQDKKEIIGNPQASALLKREYREKYKHP